MLDMSATQDESATPELLPLGPSPATLPTSRHFENRRGEGPGDEVDLAPLSILVVHVTHAFWNISYVLTYIFRSDSLE